MNQYFWDGFEKRADLRSAATGLARKAEGAAENVIDYRKLKNEASSVPMWKRRFMDKSPKSPMPSPSKKGRMLRAFTPPKPNP